MDSIAVWAPLLFFTGLAAGYLLFSDTRPRKLSRLTLTPRGWDANQIAGLFASIVVQKTPGLIPNVLLETDKTLVFEHPRPKFKTHVMFVPKKDIPDIGELSAEDMTHLADLFAVVGAFVKARRLTDYRLWTNGPGRQDVAYLHFHLGADE